MTSTVTFGSLVRQAREAKGLTQRQLADTLGKRHSHISQTETGQTEPNLRTLKKFAKALDVPISALLPPEDGQSTALPKPARKIRQIGAKFPVKSTAFAVLIVALGIGIVKANNIQQSIYPPSAEFNLVYAQYPRKWEPITSSDCFNKLSASDRDRVQGALDNYKKQVLQLRNGGAVPAWKYDKTFFCNDTWKNFTNE